MCNRLTLERSRQRQRRLLCRSIKNFSQWWELAAAPALVQCGRIHARDRRRVCFAVNNLVMVWNATRSSWSCSKNRLCLCKEQLTVESKNETLIRRPLPVPAMNVPVAASATDALTHVTPPHFTGTLILSTTSEKWMLMRDTEPSRLPVTKRFPKNETAVIACEWWEWLWMQRSASFPETTMSLQALRQIGLAMITCDALERILFLLAGGVGGIHLRETLWGAENELEELLTHLNGELNLGRVLAAMLLLLHTWDIIGVIVWWELSSNAQKKNSFLCQCATEKSKKYEIDQKTPWIKTENSVIIFK